MYGIFLLAIVVVVVVGTFAMIYVGMSVRKPDRRRYYRDRYNPSASRDVGGGAYIGDSWSSTSDVGMGADGGSFGGGGASGSWGDSGGDSGGGGDGGGGD